LPESQLDRFLMRIGLGYPDETLERELLVGEDRRILLERLKPAVDKNDVITMQNAAHGVHVSSAILDYVQALVRFTRETSGIELGLSPRGAQDLIHAAKCWAMISGHAGVHPEDVKTVFPAVSNHRLRTDSGALDTMPDLAEFILESVPVP
ncbi:MAG: MoxR family ATPase, partial [Gammaproteobacteria bacterium]|nr:MoxR family ATPase [Gammaproteobacteria bacterium]